MSKMIKSNIEDEDFSKLFLSFLFALYSDVSTIMD